MGKEGIPSFTPFPLVPLLLKVCTQTQMSQKLSLCDITEGSLTSPRLATTPSAGLLRLAPALFWSPCKHVADPAKRQF